MLANIERELLAVDPQYKTGQDLQLMTDTLNGSIAALDKMKGDSDKITEQLEDILRVVAGKHKTLENAVERTMNASSTLSSKTGSVVGRLSKAKTFLDIALRAERAPTATEMASAFDDYFQAIKAPLDNHLVSVPIIGDLLEAYGEAIHSAAVSIGTIESLRRDQRDLMKEITGKDYYRPTSEKERKWQALINQASALSNEIEELDCDNARPDKEVPDVSQEIIDECEKNAGLTKNDHDEQRHLFHLIFSTKSYIKQSKLELNKLDRYSNFRLKSPIAAKKKSSVISKAALANTHPIVVKYIQEFYPTYQQDNAKHLPLFPTEKEQIEYTVRYLEEMKSRPQVYNLVRNYLKDAKEYREGTQEIIRLENLLQEVEIERAVLVRKIESNQALLQESNRKVAAHGKKLQSMSDCIEKAIEKKKPKSKSPTKSGTCAEPTSILGGLGRVMDEIDGKCAGNNTEPAKPKDCTVLSSLSGNWKYGKSTNNKLGVAKITHNDNFVDILAKWNPTSTTEWHYEIKTIFSPEKCSLSGTWNRIGSIGNGNFYAIVDPNDGTFTTQQMRGANAADSNWNGQHFSH